MTSSHDTAAPAPVTSGSIIGFESVRNIGCDFNISGWPDHTINGREWRNNFLIRNIGGFNITGGLLALPPIVERRRNSFLAQSHYFQD